MGLLSGIFPGNNGDRKYTTTQLATFKKAQMTTGIFLNLDNGCIVSKISNTMKTSIGIGGGIIEGYDFYNDAAYELTHATADANNPRVDLIVARLDLSVEARNISFAILQGIPSVSPATPNTTQRYGYYEIPLAKVTIGSGVSTLNSSGLIDMRSPSLANAQNGMVIAGYYTGTTPWMSNGNQTITLGFKPRAVHVLPVNGDTRGGINNGGYYGGLAINGSNCKTGDGTDEKIIEIIDTGFKVYSQFYKSIHANIGGYTYNYVAYC